MKKPQLKIKIAHYIIPILLSYIIPINISNTSALDYQSSTNLEFTFTPTLNLSVSGDLIIDELSPGTSADSNVINVSVSTNSVTGYNLSATVGSSANATTNLTHSTSNANFFTGLSTSNSCITLDATCDNEHANIWGYSYSNDNGSTWSNYSGLPLYTSSGTILNEKYLPTEDNVKFKIAARASNTQISGNYTNVINFYAVGNPEIKYYMHEFTNDLCSTLAADNNYTVYDIRDGNDYTVRYINGQCWMTQNLRITGTISAQYSNFTGNDFNVSEYSLDANDASYTDHCDTTNGYNYACAKYSGNTTTGAWYNYYAATAGTISTDDNTTPATSDICPPNWKIPSVVDMNNVVGTEYAALFNNYGYYSLGILKTENTGWWSSSFYSVSTNVRVTLINGNYHLGKLVIYNAAVYRTDGRFIRCVRSS